MSQLGLCELAGMGALKLPTVGLKPRATDPLLMYEEMKVIQEIKISSCVYK
jgi:hypothetical protein